MRQLINEVKNARADLREIQKAKDEQINKIQEIKSSRWYSQKEEDLEKAQIRLSEIREVENVQRGNIKYWQDKIDQQKD